MLLLFTIMIALTPKMDFKPPQPRTDQEPFMVSVELPSTGPTALELVVSGDGFDPDLVKGKNFALLLSGTQPPEGSRIVIKGLEQMQADGGGTNTVQVVFHHRNQDTVRNISINKLSGDQFVVWPRSLPRSQD